jgi:hypothetical protein
VSTCGSRATLIAEKTKVEAQLVKLYAAYDEALDNVEVESYKFDSSEGSQQTKRRDPLKIQELIDKLEAKLGRIERKLCPGGGLVSMNMRRKSGTAYRGRG